MAPPWLRPRHDHRCHHFINSHCTHLPARTPPLGITHLSAALWAYGGWRGAREEGGGRGQVCRVEQKAELVVKEAFCFPAGTLFAVAGSNVCLCRAACSLNGRWNGTKPLMCSFFVGSDAVLLLLMGPDFSY